MIQSKTWCLEYWQMPKQIKSWRGLSICPVSGAWRLARAANLLTVPPMPSHGLLPCDVAKKFHSAFIPKSASWKHRFLRFLQCLYWLLAPLLKYVTNFRSSNCDFKDAMITLMNAWTVTETWLRSSLRTHWLMHDKFSAPSSARKYVVKGCSVACVVSEWKPCTASWQTKCSVIFSEVKQNYSLIWWKIIFQLSEMWSLWLWNKVVISCLICCLTEYGDELTHCTYKTLKLALSSMCPLFVVDSMYLQDPFQLPQIYFEHEAVSFPCLDS